jgi:replicative DNA helicase
MLLERNTDHVETMPQIALRSMDRLTAERLPGISLGFTELDEMLDGAKPAQLILLAARPGVGKSAMAGNIVSHVAKQGRGVFMSSIEMSNDELFDRLLCAKLGVSLKELRPMARCEHDGPKVNDARHELTQLPITCSDAAEQTVSSIGAAARLVKRKHGVELIVVDYLQLVTPSNRRDSRELQVATIAWGLKCLAKQLNVPVLALAQLNREIDKRPDKTPRMSDLRESGALEQHAAVVLFLDRPGLWDQNADPDKAVLHVAKNRGGPVGRVDLKWDGRSATFRGCDDLAGGNDLFDPFENRMDFQ